MQGEQQYGSAPMPTGTLVQPEQQYGSTPMPTATVVQGEQQYGSAQMPTGTVQQTGHIIAVAQAPQPIAVAAIAPSIPTAGPDFIPSLNQNPPENPPAGYLFGEGDQGWGYYAVGSAGCDALALRLLYGRKARSEKALRNVRRWSFMFCCLLSKRRAALEARVREYNGLLKDMSARTDWAARMARSNPDPLLFLPQKRDHWLWGIWV